MIVYLDNAATTPVLPHAAEASLRAMTECFYNPSALYAQALESSALLERSRAAVAALMCAPQADVIFTSGGTEGNNLAIIGSVNAMRAGKKHLVTSRGEHPAVLECFRYLEGAGHVVEYIGLRTDGTVDLDELEAKLREDTVLVSVMRVNNETGAVNDLARVKSLINAVCPAALLHSDGVQALGRVHGDVKELGVDLYTVSGHKLHAPKGVGALYAKKALRFAGAALGGGQESTRRSGTENLPGIAAFGAAAESVAGFNSNDIMRLKLKMHERLADIDGAAVNGPMPEKGAPHILNMSFVGVGAEVLLHALEAEGVLVGTGAACSSRKRKESHVLKAMGVGAERTTSAVRFSLSYMNTEQDVDIAADAVIKNVAILRRFKRR